MQARTARLAAPIAIAVMIVAVALVLWRGGARSPEERDVEAQALVDAVTVSVSVDDPSLLAARAIADFGVGSDVRLVLVRILDEMRIRVRVETAKDVVLTPPVTACLVGPDPAPDDAGLSDRCWGGSDLSAQLTAALPVDASGRLHLVKGTPVTITALVSRGPVGCDYPPGAWRLEFRVDPVVDGMPAARRYVPDARFDVPYEAAAPLTLVEERRYCGLASKVYREQGEPSILAP